MTEAGAASRDSQDAASWKTSLLLASADLARRIRSFAGDLGDVSSGRLLAADPSSSHDVASSGNGVVVSAGGQAGRTDGG